MPGRCKLKLVDFAPEAERALTAKFPKATTAGLTDAQVLAALKLLRDYGGGTAKVACEGSGAETEVRFYTARDRAARGIQKIRDLTRWGRMDYKTCEKARRLIYQLPPISQKAQLALAMKLGRRRCRVTVADFQQKV